MRAPAASAPRMQNPSNKRGPQDGPRKRGRDGPEGRGQNRAARRATRFFWCYPTRAPERATAMNWMLPESFGNVNRTSFVSNGANFNRNRFNNFKINFCRTATDSTASTIYRGVRLDFGFGYPFGFGYFCPLSASGWGWGSATAGYGGYGGGLRAVMAATVARLLMASWLYGSALYGYGYMPYTNPYYGRSLVGCWPCLTTIRSRSTP